jgi:hypothetical protein
VPANVTEAFDHLLEQAWIRLSATEETRRYADLQVGFTKLEWEKRRYFAISRAEAEAAKRERAGARRQVRKPGSRPPSLTEVMARRSGRAVEVPFASPALRICGRVDLIEYGRHSGISLSDFKSGAVTDVEGVMNEEASLQLRLYGLAVAELAPKDAINLTVLGQGREYPVSFHEDDRVSIASWLRDVTDRLPAGCHVDSRSLAVVGPKCLNCGFRPVCPAYRDILGEAWKRSDNLFKLPLDIAGTIIGREEDGEFVSLKMRDLAGRTIKIHRLQPSTAPPSLAGQRAWLFDLASIETTMTNVGWRHPWNFHQMAATPQERTAWTLRVFIENSRT